MTFVTLLGSQLQVIVLARYPDGISEIANLAVANAVIMLFRSGLLFIPQLTNVYGYSTGSRRAVFWFVVIISSVSTFIFAFVGWGPIGDWVLLTMFERREGDLPLEQIKEYCRWFAPTLLLEGVRGYYMGLLIQNRKTGAVSLLNVVSLVSVGLLLYVGYIMKLPAVTVVGGSQLVGVVLTLLMTWVVYRYRYYQREPEEQQIPTQKELWNFFAPIMLTGFFFVVSRPIITAFAGKATNPVEMLVVTRLVFEISFFMVAPLNQFRNLYVTFGKMDLAGVRNFSVLVLGVILAIMLLILLTPLSTWVFGTIYGMQEPVLTMVIQGAWIVLLMPVVLTIRNYYHGLCMIRKVTGRMGYAGIGRVLIIALLAWWLTELGYMNQWAIPGILVIGFIVEAIGIAWQFRKESRKEETSG